MSLFKLFRKLWPFVKPYRWLVICTLVLTLIGSTIAQVNAIVLDRTVDAINSLIGAGGISWREASKILILRISLARRCAHLCRATWHKKL